jgi:hypothetical protein
VVNGIGSLFIRTSESYLAYIEEEAKKIASLPREEADEARRRFQDELEKRDKQFFEKDKDFQSGILIEGHEYTCSELQRLGHRVRVFSLPGDEYFDFK